MALSAWEPSLGKEHQLETTTGQFQDPRCTLVGIPSHLAMSNFYNISYIKYIYNSSYIVYRKIVGCGKLVTTG